MNAILTFALEVVIWTLTFIGAAATYGLIRNQRVAAKSPIVDTTNPLPRLAAVWEVLIHPDRAATWEREILPGQEPHERKTWDEGGNPVFLTRVFPNLDKDLSEMQGIRPDDGEVS